MMLVEPNIDVKALEAIKAPTLVLAGDHDLIRDEHTLDIFHHIPNSPVGDTPERHAHGAIRFVGATFNAVLERFFRAPFRQGGPHCRHDEALEKMHAQKP